MFCDVPSCLWMFREKDDIIILAKAVGENPKKCQIMKPLQGKTCEGFSIARSCGNSVRGGEKCAQKTIKALQVSRLPEPDGWTVLPGTPEESR